MKLITSWIVVENLRNCLMISEPSPNLNLIVVTKLGSVYIVGSDKTAS